MLKDTGMTVGKKYECFVQDYMSHKMAIGVHLFRTII